jgi:hypothetical protein
MLLIDFVLEARQSRPATAKDRRGTELLPSRHAAEMFYPQRVGVVTRRAVPERRTRSSEASCTGEEEVEARLKAEPRLHRGLKAQ